MLLNKEWVNDEIEEEIIQILETNENEHKTVENLWDTVKAVLRERFRTKQAYLKKIQKFK